MREKSGTAKSFSDRGDFLGRLLKTKNGPVVVFLESPNSDENGVVTVHNRARYSHRDYSYKPEPGEDEAYMLYSVLRSAQETEDLDAQADKKFEKTKQLLRSAFSQRCSSRAKCEDKCPPPPKKQGCQHNCQAVFDELNACNEKPKDTCEKKKPEPTCGGKGKTMPPKWLLRMLRSRDRD
ncbi:uncharacterized protein LOC126378202 [Pectinophora gossypiella]|uniref:uncharacterized protein LOC126378202 n=1 Tax=Pectinophora gossypiella TaxID=13191 RepID=UPI00214E9E5F|nr:uncharacterized protein LOC126378202 [Pectinophora gossypiella]